MQAHIRAHPSTTHQECARRWRECCRGSLGSFLHWLILLGLVPAGQRGASLRECIWGLRKPQTRGASFFPYAKAIIVPVSNAPEEIKLLLPILQGRNERGANTVAEKAMYGLSATSGQ